MNPRPSARYSRNDGSLSGRNGVDGMAVDCRRDLKRLAVLRLGLSCDRDLV